MQDERLFGLHDDEEAAVDDDQHNHHGAADNAPADTDIAADPMVAANYHAQRSELAKKIGLGQKRRRKDVVAASAPPQSVGKRKVGRPRRAAAESTPS